MGDRGQAALTRVSRIGSRFLFRAPSDLPLPWRLKRRWTVLVGMTNRKPGGFRRQRTTLAGIPCDRLLPEETRRGSILYLHGGAYVQGAASVQRPAAGGLAAGSGATTFVPDYRLAPEHPFPAAFDDALAAYTELAEREPDGVILAGDSAGGGLAVAVAIAARDRGMPPPAGIFVICPWLDLAADRSAGPDTDPILSRAIIGVGARAYLGGADASDPRCSPIHGDLAGLPPILIHTAAEDPLRPDSEALAEKARDAGVEAELEEFPLWHDFHQLAGTLTVAAQAVGKGAAFARDRLAG